MSGLSALSGMSGRWMRTGFMLDARIILGNPVVSGCESRHVPMSGRDTRGGMSLRPVLVPLLSFTMSTNTLTQTQWGR
jgi:hypothetical protein